MMVMIVDDAMMMMMMMVNGTYSDRLLIVTLKWMEDLVFVNKQSIK